MKKQTIICYRGEDGDTKPVKCICETEFGYPNFCTDENGIKAMMYDNTHFKDISGAWKSINNSVKAGLHSSGLFLKRVQAELKHAEIEAIKSLSDYTEVKCNPENPYRDKL